MKHSFTLHNFLLLMLFYIEVLFHSKIFLSMCGLMAPQKICVALRTYEYIFKLKITQSSFKKHSYLKNWNRNE